MIYIGIDPGASGGLVTLSTKASWESDGTVSFKTMPPTEEGVWNWISSFSNRAEEAYAMIEWISPAMFGTDKGSMSKLYGSYKSLRMALVAAGLPFTDVKPSAWQRAVGILPRKKLSKESFGETRSEWKQRLKRHAEKIFPQLHITLSTADALLIAHHCRLTKGPD